MPPFRYTRKGKDAFRNITKQKSFWRLSSAALQVPDLSISLPAALAGYFFSIREKKSVGIVCSCVQRTEKYHIIYSGLTEWGWKDSFLLSLLWQCNLLCGI